MEKSLRLLDLRGFIRSNSFFPREVKQWQLNYSLDTVLLNTGARLYDSGQ
jgi:hypothetical protein